MSRECHREGLGRFSEASRDGDTSQRVEDDVAHGCVRVEESGVHAERTAVPARANLPRGVTGVQVLEPIFQAARLRASERDDGGASLVVPPDVPVDVGLVAGEDGDVGDARAVAVEAGPGVEAGVAVGGAGEGNETLGFGLVVSRGGARRERVARSRGERHVGGDATRRELDRAVDARLANREDARREREREERRAKRPARRHPHRARERAERSAKSNGAKGHALTTRDHPRETARTVP